MQTTGKFNRSLRIILAITAKDILDALKNKTTISVIVSALFLLLFYIFLPMLEQDSIIRLYDADGSTWLPALEQSQPFKISDYSTQEAMLYRISRSGELELGLVLPHGFDQAVSKGGSIELQGYLLNWVSHHQTEEMITKAKAQISAVVGVPVTITLERLFMLPESTGTSLSRALGSLLLILMSGMVLVPNLMLEEKRARTLDALMVSPASAGQITIGKAFAGLFFCLLGYGLACLFNASLIIQWGLTLLAGTCAALFSVAFGMLLGELVENRQQMTLSANFTIFPMVIAVFISIETELLPAWLVSICRWLPVTAAFDLLRTSFTPHTNMAFIVSRSADILLFVILILAFVAWKIRRSDRV